MATPKDVVPFESLLPSAEVFGPEAKSKSTKSPVIKGASKPALAKSNRGLRPDPDAPRPPRKPVSASQEAKRSPKSTASKPTSDAKRLRSSQISDSRTPRVAPRPPKKYDNQYFHEFDGQRGTSEIRPQTGWRGALLKTTGLNVGASAEDRRAAENLAKLRQKVSEGSIGVFSRKGGVGKTTISAYLGTTLSSLRGGRIIALDGDAEAGSLGWLLAPKAPATLKSLAQASASITDYSQIRNFVATTDEGLDVIVGEAAENGVLSAVEMQSVAGQVARHYDLSIFDTGAGVTRATGAALVHQARVLLLVMGPSVDSVRAAERTLAWLEERPGVAARADAQVIAVINGIPSDAKEAHIQRIESHFADRCAAVARIPWDASLAQGITEVSLDSLSKDTRVAFENLAATTVNVLSQKGQKAGTLGVRRAS